LSGHAGSLPATLVLIEPGQGLLAWKFFSTAT